MLDIHSYLCNVKLSVGLSLNEYCRLDTEGHQSVKVSHTKSYHGAACDRWTAHLLPVMYGHFRLKHMTLNEENE